MTDNEGGGGQGVEGLSKKEKIMDMDNSVVIAIRGLNGNRKKTNKD